MTPSFALSLAFSACTAIMLLVICSMSLKTLRMKEFVCLRSLRFMLEEEGYIAGDEPGYEKILEALKRCISSEKHQKYYFVHITETEYLTRDMVCQLDYFPERLTGIPLFVPFSRPMNLVFWREVLRLLERDPIIIQKRETNNHSDHETY